MITLTVDRHATGYERKVMLQPSEISSIEEPDSRERWHATVTMRNGTVHRVDQSPPEIERLLAALAASDPGADRPEVTT